MATRLREDAEILVGEGYLRADGHLPTEFYNEGAYADFLSGEWRKARNYGWQGGFLAGLCCSTSVFLFALLLWRLFA